MKLALCAVGLFFLFGSGTGSGDSQGCGGTYEPETPVPWGGYCVHDSNCMQNDKPMQCADGECAWRCDTLMSAKECADADGACRDGFCYPR